MAVPPSGLYKVQGWRVCFICKDSQWEEIPRLLAVGSSIDHPPSKTIPYLQLGPVSDSHFNVFYLRQA